MVKQRILLVCIFILLLIASLFIVSYSNFIPELLKGNPDALLILTHSSIPRTITIVLTAISLSVSGVIMQAIGRNKFISASTIGTTDAALLGILIGVIAFPKLNNLARLGFGFGFALISTFVFVLLMQKIKFKNIIFVPLMGMMYGALIGAITTIIAQQAGMEQILAMLRQASFGHINSQNFRIVLFVIPALIFAILYATKFNIVMLGEDFSKNLGVNYRLVIIIGLCIVSIISASTFIVVGPIPFVGLIVPNLVTLYYGENVKKNLFDVALFGGILVLLVEIISRLLVYPYLVPISLTMGIVGAIIFAVLLMWRMRRGS
ncbi:MAG: iron chelate uptake ABC transporter family permease subunit [Bacteroidales bacterium]